MISAHSLLSPTAFRFTLVAAVLLFSAGVGPAQTLYNSGDPSPDAQFMLELLNRARANPLAEGVRLGQTDFGGYAARPPIAFSAKLLSSALTHNNDMAANNYFSHTGSDGSTPDSRIRATGYVPGEDGENIADGFPTAEAAFDALMIDNGIPDLGHRRNFLEFDQTTNFFREIGVVTVDGGDTTQDFGYQASLTFLCGVAYHDTDGNGFYTQGEGLGGIKVTSPASSYYAVTSASGGYTLPIDRLETGSGAQTTTVTFTLSDGSTKTFGATFTPSTYAANTIIGGAFDNVKVDLVFTDPAFFQGQEALTDGVYYLAFPNGNYFGYYSYLSDPHYLYHFDLGYEYVFDAGDGKGGVYLYDFKSNGFFYTSPTFSFPYLYDFKLSTVLYYYPDPSNAGRYDTNGVRFFYDFSTGKVISK